MQLTLGFSTCPNDTFIFDAMIHQKVDTEGLQFDVILADVEELNRNAFNGTIDITKLSYHAFAHISTNYKLLTSGSALGYKNGPLIISKRKIYPDELGDVKMAIPGKMTTANFLLSILFPEVQNKSEYLFSDIEEAIQSNEMDAGLIIHETRFVYAKNGLKLVSDLGALWEEKFKLPIPLGGIVVKRSLRDSLKLQIQQKVSESVKFAFANRLTSLAYIKQHAQELDDAVINQHVDLYVNEFSIDLGEKGRSAINLLFHKGDEAGLFELKDNKIFV